MRNDFSHNSQREKFAKKVRTQTNVHSKSFCFFFRIIYFDRWYCSRLVPLTPIQSQRFKRNSIVNSTLLLNTYRSFFSFWKCSVYLHTRLAYGFYIHKACYRKGPMKQTLPVGIKNSPFKLPMAAKVAFQGFHSIKNYNWKIHPDSGILQASFRKVSSTSASLISLGPLNVFKDDSQRSLFQGTITNQSSFAFYLLLSRSYKAQKVFRTSSQLTTNGHRLNVHTHALHTSIQSQVTLRHSLRFVNGKHSDIGMLVTPTGRKVVEI